MADKKQEHDNNICDCVGHPSVSNQKQQPAKTDTKTNSDSAQAPVVASKELANQQQLDKPTGASTVNGKQQDGGKEGQQHPKENAKENAKGPGVEHGKEQGVGHAKEQGRPDAKDSKGQGSGENAKDPKEQHKDKQVDAKELGGSGATGSKDAGGTQQQPGAKDQAQQPGERNGNAKGGRIEHGPAEEPRAGKQPSAINSGVPGIGLKPSGAQKSGPLDKETPPRRIEALTKAGGATDAEAPKTALGAAEKRRQPDAEQDGGGGPSTSGASKPSKHPKQGEQQTAGQQLGQQSQQPQQSQRSQSPQQREQQQRRKSVDIGQEQQQQRPEDNKCTQCCPIHCHPRGQEGSTGSQASPQASPQVDAGQQPQPLAQQPADQSQISQSGSQIEDEETSTSDRPAARRSTRRATANNRRGRGGGAQRPRPRPQRRQRSRGRAPRSRRRNTGSRASSNAPRREANSRSSRGPTGRPTRRARRQG